MKFAWRGSGGGSTGREKICRARKVNEGSTAAAVVIITRVKALRRREGSSSAQEMA